MNSPTVLLGQLDVKYCLFDWGNTLMADLPGMRGPMCDWPDVALVEDAERVLKTLSSRFICHLATNAADSDSTQIRKALSRGGLSSSIQQIFCKATLNSDKGSAGYYDAIVECLSTDPSSIVMIGDSLDQDVLAALNHGLNAIWFNPSRRPVPEGIHAVNHLKQLIGE